MKQERIHLIFDTIIKVFVGVVLVVAATTKQPYVFYSFLRWTVFLSSFYFAYRSYSRKEIALLFLFAAIAIVFNPAQKIQLQKGTWHLIDYSVAVIILLSIFYNWFAKTVTSSNSSTMTINNNITKKRIAREVLLFFGAAGLVGIIWLFLSMRNFYYENKRTNLKTEISSLTTQLDSLPKDRIKSIYDEVNQSFVVNYKVKSDRANPFEVATLDFHHAQYDKDDNYAIPKREEQAFLKDYPKAEKLPNYPKGYSFFKLYSVSIKPNEIIKYYDTEDLGRKIKGRYSEYSDISDIDLGKKVLKKYPQHTDSTIVFDYVDLKTFRKLLEAPDYRINFYEIFQWDKYIVNGYTESGLPIFKNFDLGTRSTFEIDIQQSLKNGETIEQSRNNISNEIELKKTSLKNAGESIWDNDRVKWFLLTTILIVVIIIYPVRLCFLLIKWAIKTAK